MKYRIRDCQFDYRCFADGVIYTDKLEILEQLAGFHGIDYEGVKDNDEPYYDIWEFLDTLKNDEEKLNWLLEYGQWEIEEVKEYEKVERIINNFILYFTSDDKERKNMGEALEIYLKEGKPF